MWRVLLAFVVTRILLFVIALFTLNSNPAGNTIPAKFAPYAVLQNQFIRRVSERPEVSDLQRVHDVSVFRVFRVSSSPFTWMAHWLRRILGLSPAMACTWLSNLFFLLFLWEINRLLSRMVTSEVATATPILVLLWPTSFDLSLGSSFALTCFLTTWSIREALDDHWIVAGFATALLALTDPIAIGVLPLLLYMFWYFQRHYPLGQVTRRSAYFLVPAGAALLWKIETYEHLGNVVSHSALLHFFLGSQSLRNVSWTLTHSFAGQTVTAILFGIGAVAAGVQNAVFVHQIIPVYLFLLFLIFSPYEALSIRAPLAGLSLQGVASMSAPRVLRLVQMVLLAISAYEVRIFFEGR